jgi:hypothetical protein
MLVLVKSNNEDRTDRTDEVGTRIQIACYDKLVAEVIVQNSREADRTWAKYASLKYRAGKPMGCCVMNRADMKRMWDVPVGSIIHSTTTQK